MNLFKNSIAFKYFLAHFKATSLFLISMKPGYFLPGDKECQT